MKALINFFKTTLIGGLLVVLPVWICILLLIKGAENVDAFLKPLTSHLPGSGGTKYGLAAAIVLGGCFAIGLLVRTALGRRAKLLVERNILEKIPGYRLFRSVAEQMGEIDEGGKLQPALVQADDGLVPAFLVERHAGGRCTVFVPSAPTVAAGSVRIVNDAQVQLVDVSLATMMSCISRWGEGCGEMLAKLKGPLPPLH